VHFNGVDLAAASLLDELAWNGSAHQTCCWQGRFEVRRYTVVGNVLFAGSFASYLSPTVDFALFIMLHCSG
jgi:hypothetical protein